MCKYTNHFTQRSSFQQRTVKLKSELNLILEATGKDILIKR
jgi:hypothetical protein